MVSAVVTFHLELAASYETVMEPAEDVTEERVAVMVLQDGEVVGLVHV